MPTNAKQVEQDVRALSNALIALADASGGAASGYQVFEDVLKRLSPAIPAAGYSKINDELALMQRLVRGIGASAGVSQPQLAGMVKALEKLQDIGRLKFSQGDQKNALKNVTGGGTKRTTDPSPFADFLGTPEFERGVLGGAKAINTVQKALERINVDRVRDMKFEMSDVTNVAEDGAQQVTRWSFGIEKANQPIRRATITTNRWGKELRTTSRQLRSFGSGIARDIVEVTKWSIAIAVVYAPLKRLTDLIREATAIESKLADVQVALANSSTNLTQVWEQSAKIARELGVSVEGVIDGYVLATRATANILNPAERAAATTAVLRDSMLLAKLAGIDQAVAMDTLVGALRQLQVPLSDGQELLDKWVAVSKAANVSIGTLAESFAITATAAGNVGISIDKLNGIIAAVAEVTTLSATESGNAVRAFISGFQKDRSERELTRFGISVRAVNGELRSFTEIIEDIVARREVGLISDRELAKLSEIIGGGARRGPQVNAILENYGRVNELAAVSAEANGDAAAALSIKMDTLETATQNLDNAFTELARALGGDAGFLDGAQDTVKVLTSVVDALTSVVQVLGKATPAIIAFSAAFIALRHSARLQGLLGQNLAQFAGRIPLVGGALRSQAIQRGGLAGLQPIGSRLAGFFGRGGGAIGGAAIGLGAAALSGQNLGATGSDRTRTGATIGAAAIATMLSGGNPIGGIIGAAAVQAIFSNFIDREVELTDSFTRVFTAAFDQSAPDEVDAQTRVDEREKELFSLLGGTFQIEELGRFQAGVFAAFAEHKVTPSQEGIEDITSALAAIATDRGGGGLGVNIVEFLFDISLNEKEKARIKEILDEMIEEGRAAAEAAAPFREGTAFARAVVGIQDVNIGTGQAIFQARRKEVVQEVGRGQAGVRQLRDLEDLGQLFDNQLDTIYAGLTVGARDTALSYEESANIIIKASEEERKGFIDLAGDVSVLFNIFEELSAGGAPQIAIAGAAGDLQAQQRRLDEAITLTGASQEFRAFQQPDFIDIKGEITPQLIQQLNELVDLARIETDDLIETMEVSDVEKEKIVEGYGEVGFLAVEAWEVALQGIEGVSPRILKQFVEDAELTVDELSLSIQTPDITGAEFAQAVQQRLPGINELIKSVRREAGFAEEDLLDLEDIGFIFKDNVTDVLHADQLAIQLLLRDIKELNEDQLEGIFNIPEGVTALIPFTGQLFFSDQPIAGPGGEGDLALGSDIEGQTDILHGDLLEVIDGLRREEAVLTAEQITKRREELGLRPLEEAVLTPEQIAQRREELSTDRALNDVGVPIDFEQLGRDFDAFKLLEGFDFEQLGSDFDDFKNQELANNLAARVDPRSITGTLGLGNFANILEAFEAALPQAIPVTINTRITNPVSVFVDGRLIQQAVEERSFQDLGSATRRAGALGYVQE